MISILNGAEKFGTSFDEFKRENEELALATHVKTVFGRDITFLSLCDVPEFQEDESTVFWLLDDSSLRDFRKYNKPLKRAFLKDSKYPKECIDELKNTTRLMFLINGDKYMVSQHAMATLGQQASVSGTLTLNRGTQLRDMHLADALFYKNEEVTLVYRSINCGGIFVEKIYAVFAGAYKEIPQTIVRDIANAIIDDEVMGKANINSWGISHEVTRLEMSYPKIGEDYAKEYGIDDVTPGVMIQTSDVGDSAICVYGTQRIKSSFVITDEITAKHTKKNEETKKIIESVDEKIFFNHRKLPELLVKLIGRDAVDYDAADAYNRLCELVKEAIEKTLKGVLSKRQIQSLTDSLLLELSPGVQYTLYDIAIMLMELPERIKGIDDSLMISVRKALSKAPIIVDEKCDVYLTA